MKALRARTVLALSVMLVSAGAAAPSGATVGKTSRLSVSSAERQGDNSTPATSVQDTTSPAMALAGGHVAFSSDATNLVSRDTNGVADVFVRNISRGTTTRVSVSSSEVQANGPSHSPAISLEGDLVAFVSAASNLVRGDTNGVADVFLRDLRRGTTRRISVSSAGAQGNGPAIGSTSMSLFGRWIGFDSEASNLASGDTNGMPDAFVYDIETRRTVRIAPPRVSQDDPKPNEAAWTSTASVSYDGKWVAFQRIVARLMPAQTPLPQDVAAVDPRLHRPGLVSRMDVYMMSMRTRKVRRVEIGPWGGLAPYRNFHDNPSISADGRYVVLDAWSVLDHESGDFANDLDDDGFVRNPLDPKDVFVYDRAYDTNYLVSKNSIGQAGNGDSTDGKISSQGHAVTFSSDATNLAAGDENNATDVFVWDSRDRATSRVSVDSKYTEAATPSTRPSMSYDARHIVFASAAPLASGDSNAASDVFRHDRLINIADTAPMLRPYRSVLSLDAGVPFQMTLRGSDKDGDPLRYGLLAEVPPIISEAQPVVLPSGASVDAKTGVFSWTPRLDQSGPWYFAFWVNDPRGRVQQPPLVGKPGKQSYCLTCAGTFVFARMVVRTAKQSVDCRVDPSAAGC